MEISFLIPTRNRPDNLKRNLLSLSKLNIRNLHFEIIVLDDCSELSYDSVLLEFKNIQYYKNSTSMGIAYARNKLAQLAEGKYLIFLDDDVLISENTSINLIFDLFEKDNTLGLVSFDISAHINNNKYSPENLFVFKQIPFKKYQLFFNPKLENEVNYVSYFIGAAFACPKEIFKSGIIFDELFFWGNEEIDFSYNIIQNNLKILYHPECKADHYPAQSVIKEESQQFNSFILFISNRILTAYKNLPGIYFISYVFIWTVYYLLISLKTFRMLDWVKGINLGIAKTKKSSRKPLSKIGIEYLKNNYGRILF